VARLAKKKSTRKSSAAALAQRLQDCVRRSGLLRAGERVGVGVSGGADSVALLLLLVGLRKSLGITLSVLHFNHKLRGRAADADEKFVAALARKYELPFYSGAAAINTIAKEYKANVEATGRRFRYLFFTQDAREHRLDKIAVAHTADDQAETVLAHILRGSGLAGIGGIHPRAGKIVRPLLAISRAELRLYLQAQRQNWREDASNRDTSRTRARIRKKLIPLLQKNFQPRVVEHLVSLADRAREDQALLQGLAGARLRRCMELIPGGVRIGVAEFLLVNPESKPDSHTGIYGASRQTSGRDESSVEDKDSSDFAEAGLTGLGGRMVLLIIGGLKRTRVNVVNGRPGVGEIGAKHVLQVLELARHGRTGAALVLPGNIEVRRQRDALEFCCKANMATPPRDYEYKIDSLSNLAIIRVAELGCVFRFTVIDWHAQRGETRLSGGVLDEARLNFPLTLRSWRYGDRFCAMGHTKPEKLKHLFAERGIDRWERAGWPVITSGKSGGSEKNDADESCDDLAWSRVFGASAKFAANDRTKTGIVIVEEKLL
jgi:tRNA(Ile)-lysidine synthetase-like protein